MGWSCASAAAHTMDDWSAACRKETGSSNSYVGKDGVDRFFDPSRREHDDGAITGATWKSLPDGEHVTRDGSWRINPDGAVARFPGSWPFAKTGKVS